MNLNIIILIILVIAALWAAMTRSLLRSAIGLALISLILTIIMFRLHSGLAAVFELSVCAGLIRSFFFHKPYASFDKGRSIAAYERQDTPVLVSSFHNCRGGYRFKFDNG